MITVKELETQMAKTQKELSAQYLKIAEGYKRMSKSKDLHTRQVIQSGIDGDLSRANQISDKSEALKKQWLDYWSHTNRGDTANKSQYD